MKKLNYEFLKQFLIMKDNPTRTIPSLQGTLAKRSKPTLQPNFAKEPFSPSLSNAKSTDAQETKKGTSIEVKCLKMNKAQHTTRGKNHCEVSAIFSITTFNQRLNGLIGRSFEFRNASYHHPCAPGMGINSRV